MLTRKTSVIKLGLLSILLVFGWVWVAGCGDAEKGGSSTSVSGGGSFSNDAVTVTISTSQDSISVGDTFTTTVIATCNRVSVTGTGPACASVNGLPWFSARPASRADQVAGPQSLATTISSSRHLGLSDPDDNIFIFEALLLGGTLDDPTTTTVDEFEPGQVAEQIRSIVITNAVEKGLATITVNFEGITAVKTIEVFESTSGVFPPVTVGADG